MARCLNILAVDIANTQSIAKDRSGEHRKIVKTASAMGETPCARGGYLSSHVFSAWFSFLEDVAPRSFFNSEGAIRSVLRSMCSKEPAGVLFYSALLATSLCLC